MVKSVRHVGISQRASSRLRKLRKGINVSVETTSLKVDDESLTIFTNEGGVYPFGISVAESNAIKEAFNNTAFWGQFIMAVIGSIKADEPS